MLGEFLAECRAGHCALACVFQCPLRAADQPHAMMDATGAKSPLRDFKSSALAKQDVFHWDTHVFQPQLGMAKGRVVVEIGGE